MKSKKTSEEWTKGREGLTVYEPDGCDRKNYQYSWFEELITEEEFNYRLSRSTCLYEVNHGLQRTT